MISTLIGITTHPANDPDRHDLDHLLAQIVAGVASAGGVPVLIPPGLSERALQGVYSRLDGVLLSGGGDVDPARYGADMHASIAGVSAERDRVEIALARWAAGAEAKPLFGICRGLQVLNVALGGTLYRDVSEHPGAQRHSFTAPDLPIDLRPHDVQVAEESTLAQVLGQPIVAVNSLHHQACFRVAPGLRVTARAPDGIVEAVELPRHRFVLGVQWHPECLPAAPEMRRLFEAFVAAAANTGPAP